MDVSNGPASANAVDGFDPAWIELEKALGGRKFLHGDVPERREQFDGMLLALSKQWPAVDGVQTHDGVTDTDPAVPLRIYRPDRSSVDGRGTRGKLPICLWFHGGGWIAGTLDSEDAQCRLVAKQVPCIVVSVGYGLAPEVGIKAILADCTNALGWVRKQAAELGGDRDSIFTVGGSAGAPLALMMAYQPIESGERSIVKGCVALNPIAVCVDDPPRGYEHLYKSFGDFENDAPVIRGPDVRGVFEIVGQPGSKEGGKATLRFAYGSPELVSQLPRTYIATSDRDVMRDDGVILEAVLADAGVPVKRDHYMGLPHYFWTFPQLEKSRAFIVNVVAGIRFVLGEQGEAGVVVRPI